jgi:hypothetical protein
MPDSRYSNPASSQVPSPSPSSALASGVLAPNDAADAMASGAPGQVGFQVHAGAGSVLVETRIRLRAPCTRR